MLDQGYYTVMTRYSLVSVSNTVINTAFSTIGHELFSNWEIIHKADMYI